MIQDCRILIIGYGTLSGFIHDELKAVGFRQIRQAESLCNMHHSDIIIIVASDGVATEHDIITVTTLYPFDFIGGGAAIVALPGDRMEIPIDTDIRVWAAKYVIGYSTFWNMQDLDWLSESLPGIENGVTSEEAQRTAAMICARISANIAAGRDVKHFPRFYLSRNLE